jgi:hypothetical protein
LSFQLDFLLYPLSKEHGRLSVVYYSLFIQSRLLLPLRTSQACDFGKFILAMLELSGPRIELADKTYIYQVTMADVEFIKSKLGVYPGFPKEVSSLAEGLPLEDMSRC